MMYTIEKADLANPQIDLAIREVIKAAFNAETLLAPGHVFKNIEGGASRPSFVLVAVENGAIIGCNAFIANDFLYKSQKVVGYQSCWTATHPAHQGKKVFVNLIEAAKKTIKEEGGGFLYGLPNDNSYPIFVKKLAFSEHAPLFTQIPRFPFALSMYIGNTLEKSSAVATIDEEQLYAHKKVQKGDAIIRVNGENGSFVWGKIETRKKFGFLFRFFIVGGYAAADGRELKSIFSKVYSNCGVSFIEVITNKSNPGNSVFKKLKPATGLNGFIYYNLNMDEGFGLGITFGAIDVF